MMHLFLGHEVFFGGVSNYLNKYRYNNAEQDNLWEALTEEAHKNEVLEDHMTVKVIYELSYFILWILKLIKFSKIRKLWTRGHCKRAIQSLMSREIIKIIRLK